MSRLAGEAAEIPVETAPSGRTSASSMNGAEMFRIHGVTV
jgi:hypothetical protein